MKLSVVIVSWNVRELLKKCLLSIGIQKDREVIVVDNNSQDGTEKMMKAFPQIKLIKNKKNLGFAKASNQGMREARGEYVLFLNPDTEILSGTLEKCLTFMEKKEIGILGCKILNPDLTIQSSVRRLPTFFNILLIFSKLPRFFKFKSIDHYLARDFDYGKTQEADQVMGAFMLVKKEVLAKIGMFDERFFLWFEEVDLCRRAGRNGFKVYYFSEASIIHHGGQSFNQAIKVKNQWRFFLSALKYFLK